MKSRSTFRDLLEIILASIALFVALVSLGLGLLMVRTLRSYAPLLEAASNLLEDPTELITAAKQSIGGGIGADRREQKRIEALMATEMIAQGGPMASLLVSFPTLQAEIRKNPASALRMAKAAQDLGLGEILEEKGKALLEGMISAKPPEITQEGPGYG